MPHYRDFGMGKSRGTMPIQLAGNIKHGGLYETAFGMTLGGWSTILAAAPRSGRPVRAVQVGGPLGAYFPRALFDTPFDYEAFTATDGLIGHGGIVVFDDTVDMAKQARFAMEFCAIEFLRQVHALPHRLDARRGAGGQDRGRRGRGCESHRARRSLQHHEVRIALRPGRVYPLPGDERAHAFPRGFRRKEAPASC